MKLVSFLLLLAPVVCSGVELVFPVDCSDIERQDNSRQSGVYTIYPLGEKSKVEVYCDMDTDRGGWTVFQRRMDGSVNFYRPWNQYKFGFGSAAGEYWLGLDSLHYLTHGRKHELIVSMEDFSGERVSARYSSFSVAEECYGYQLTVSGFTNGGAGDAMTHHNGKKFSTFDRDHDNWNQNCAKTFLGAFWYKGCLRTNPNGLYRWGEDKAVVGMCWQPWKGRHYSPKTFTMMIRPVH